MEINGRRLKQNMIELGKIGYQAGQGITRLAFGSACEKAHQFVQTLMEEAGLHVYQDAVGNLFGRLEGKRTPTSILLGSHLDTVSCGGMFDGSLGVMAAIACLQTLKEYGYRNQHTLEVVAFVGEEGSELGGCLGSRLLAGEVPWDARSQAFFSTIQVTADDLVSMVREAASLKCYLELHIEQGPHLEMGETPIGIVTSIAGTVRYRGVVSGEANHAGTTPMHTRDDALVKASRLVLRVNDVVRAMGPPLVGTVGHLRVLPGMCNVIPGEVEFSLELRHPERAVIDEAINRLQADVVSLMAQLEEVEYDRAAVMDQGVQESIQQACHTLGHGYRYLPSGAIHDAGVMSRRTPTGMIFIPSSRGISHSPEEHSSWDDVVRGAQVLLHTVLEEDQL